MNRKILISTSLFLFFLSCQNVHKEVININLSEGALNVDFPKLSLSGGSPGIELLIGKGETVLSWYPKEPAVLEQNERVTPKGNARDFSMTWNHPDGYKLTWTICKLTDLPGFSIRSAFINNSKDSIRLKNFVLLRTDQNGLVCQGDPDSWWLLPAMNYSRQAGNLAQVFPSLNRLKEQGVYGYSNLDTDDPRNDDGHWRFLDEAITLYNSMDRSGISMGAVGPGVSYVQFNYRVDNGKILAEIVGQMDKILVEPGETRISEEVLFLAQPYKEALTNLFSWMAETHNARNVREPVYGWCSWYDRYFNIDEEHILNITKSVKELKERIPLEVIQLDDGWQVQEGDWSANKKFPRGMQFHANNISQSGAIPGIWMSPVVCSIEKPADWFQNKEGRFLDPTHPEVEEFIISSVRKLKEAGYRYYKFDYNSIGDYQPNNQKMTRFEIMHHLFSLYRQSIGEESFMLACGATMRPVIGLADASRIGWDALGRWKSYPLADDSLSTLPTDVFTGITLTGMSSLINGKLFINDPDVTYLLPRAEKHIWQGPEGSFDPVKHGLNWSGLKTFHSYFGLLGGMAMMSEPIYKREYQQQNALRMSEILNYPAPDKGWSMNGDIDPWGRQFGFVAERPWGGFASVVLWNKEDTASNVVLDTYTLNSLGEKFHIWSFWDEKYLGIGNESFVARSIPAHGCALLRLTRIPEKNNLPILIGSNLHISMGSAELKSVESTSGEFKIELTDAGARDGKIYIYSLNQLKVKSAAGCEAFVVPQGQDIYALVITGRSRAEKNIINMSKEDTPKTDEEILKNPDLLQKFSKAGFDFDRMR